MLKCSKCKGIFDESFFSIDNRRKRGFKSECKKCHGNYPREKRKKDYINSDEYLKSKLNRRGLLITDINQNKELIEVQRNLLILKRTIKWSNLKM
jgi:hypothetical protein